MVIKDADTFKMWYPSFGMEIVGTDTTYIAPICYAWSLNGINWTKYPENPVVTQGDSGSWDALWVCEPFVLKRDSIYEMWYSGAGSWEDSLVMFCNFNTGYATSPDGINWTKHGMVLERGGPGEWDAYCAFAVTVILEDTLYRMWYTGIDTLTPSSEHTDFWSVGYATAPIIGVEEAQSSKLKTQNFILTAHPNPFSYKTVISYQM
jgi:predicted GH43/DUF377 family glycosyl hydrolase